MDIFNIIFSYLGARDMIDIAIVAFFTYKVFLIIQGTRAFQMLMGLGFLLALFIAGYNYNLYTVTWILTHFFDSFIIIVIILFQDQFRSALAKIAINKSFFGRQKQYFYKFLDEIIEVSSILSSKKIGALIVFERTQGLMDYIATGTRMDSEIHADVLYSIFQTNSPLHDGATIISGNKIAAAGCFLPLSQNVIEKQLGTRHRAAVGVTENSDCMAVVISEETGSITFCFSGELYSCSDSMQLRKYLQKVYLKNQPHMDKKQKLFKRKKA